LTVRTLLGMPEDGHSMTCSVFKFPHIIPSLESKGKTVTVQAWKFLGASRGWGS